MAKFKQNHTKVGKGGLSIVRVILLVAVFGVVFYFLTKLMNKIEFSDGYVVQDQELVDSLYYLPSQSKGELVHHKYYSLSYIEKYEQAEWVAYILTKKSIQEPNVPRAKRFEKDPLVSTQSAGYYDYKGSGYSRGHLAPAGDMAFNAEAMEESFFMSNMSPQVSSFNGGVWNELENLVRDWAYKNGRIVVVTGPIFSPNMKKIKGKVAVPNAYYKVLLDFDTPEQKAIGFILPNEKSDKRIAKYAVSVDVIEESTGLNFFDNLLDEGKQAELEESFDISSWPMDEKLYNKRVNQWNNR